LYKQVYDKLHDLNNPVQAGCKRLTKFKEMEKSGKLENMCAFEIHEMFGIRKEF